MCVIARFFFPSPFFLLINFLLVFLLSSRSPPRPIIYYSQLVQKSAIDGQQEQKARGQRAIDRLIRFRTMVFIELLVRSPLAPLSQRAWWFESQLRIRATIRRWKREKPNTDHDSFFFGIFARNNNQERGKKRNAAAVHKSHDWLDAFCPRAQKILPGKKNQGRGKKKTRFLSPFLSPSQWKTARISLTDSWVAQNRLRQALWFLSTTGLGRTPLGGNCWAAAHALPTPPALTPEHTNPLDKEHEDFCTRSSYKQTRQTTVVERDKFFFAQISPPFLLFFFSRRPLSLSLYIYIISHPHPAHAHKKKFHTHTHTH